MRVAARSSAFAACRSVAARSGARTGEQRSQREYRHSREAQHSCRNLSHFQSPDQSFWTSKPTDTDGAELSCPIRKQWRCLASDQQNSNAQEQIRRVRNSGCGGRGGGRICRLDIRQHRLRRRQSRRHGHRRFASFENQVRTIQHRAGTRVMTLMRLMATSACLRTGSERTCHRRAYRQEGD